MVICVLLKNENSIRHKYRFAADFFKAQGKELAYETFSTMYDAFNGHTWYIQIILNRLYSHGDQPDDRLVNRVISEISDESGYMYESLLSAYSPSNIRLLKAIAKEKCVKEINAGDFITRHNLKAASSVNSSLKKLIDKELISIASIALFGIYAVAAASIQRRRKELLAGVVAMTSKLS